MPHRGEKVKEVLDDLGIVKTRLAKKIDVHSDTLHNWFKDPDLPFEKIRKIGNAIGYDFSKIFPDYPYQSPLAAEDDRAAHDPEFITMDDCVKDRNHWRHKYYTTVEKYNDLLEEYMDMIKSNK